MQNDDLINKSDSKSLESKSIQEEGDGNSQNLQSEKSKKSLINDKHIEDPLIWLIQNKGTYERVDVLV